jgi:hypothetical protein
MKKLSQLKRHGEILVMNATNQFGYAVKLVIAPLVVMKIITVKA